MFQQIAVDLDEIYQLDFLKVIVFSCSTKGAMTGSFRWAPGTLSILYIGRIEFIQLL